MGVTEIEQINSFIAALPDGAVVSLRRPETPDGVWWLDVKVDGGSDTLTWQEGQGFGIYLDTEPSCGVDPDIQEREPTPAAMRSVRPSADLPAMRSDDTRLPSGRRDGLHTWFPRCFAFRLLQWR